MIRRNFIKGISLLPGLAFAGNRGNTFNETLQKKDLRKYWLDTLLRIAGPVLTALSNDRLKQEMPVETVAGEENERKKVTYLEALGRTLAGIAPWLELDDDNTQENELRDKFTALCVAAIKNAVTPTSSDYMNFTEGRQPLVDAAFLAHALIRSPKKLWSKLDPETQQHLITALRATRIIKPYYSNWLLFTAMIEAALLKFSNEYDAVRVDYALHEHQTWYKGDGMYGDGADFHFDYYNGFVIRPMLTDILKVLSDAGKINQKEYDQAITRMQRYGVIQERLISPEGTFPVVGRSMTYRNAVFQPLVQLALHEQLPAELKPGQVRAALTAVMKNIFETPGTFDKDGWLQLGFCGHQPEIADVYTSTGSLYLCTTGFLALGLPEKNAFWTASPEEWTGQKAWAGKTVKKDHAL